MKVGKKVGRKEGRKEGRKKAPPPMLRRSSSPRARYSARDPRRPRGRVASASLSSATARRHRLPNAVADGGGAGGSRVVLPSVSPRLPSLPPSLPHSPSFRPPPSFAPVPVPSLPPAVVVGGRARALRRAHVLLRPFHARPGAPSSSPSSACGLVVVVVGCRLSVVVVVFTPARPGGGVVDRLAIAEADATPSESNEPRADVRRRRRPVHPS